MPAVPSAADIRIADFRYPMHSGQWMGRPVDRFVILRGHPHPSRECRFTASRPGESHPRALPEPCVNLSIHTAPDVQPLKCINGFASALELLPLPVGSEPGLNNAAPSVQPHYRAFIPTTSRSAPVLRIGTLILADSAAWIPPLASQRQVLTFHTRAWSRTRRRHGGCRSGSLQETPELIPGEGRAPGFDIV
jgi:hypothetical protein